MLTCLIQKLYSPKSTPSTAFVCKHGQYTAGLLVYGECVLPGRDIDSGMMRPVAGKLFAIVAQTFT